MRRLIITVFVVTGILLAVGAVRADSQTYQFSTYVQCCDGERIPW